MRRALAALLLSLALVSAAAETGEDAPRVRPGVALAFPRDRGSHPAFRNEWWYVTGRLRTADGRSIGMQITFFRNRPLVAEGVAGDLAPRQLLFAHAALSDPAVGHLLSDERAARAGLGLAEAREGRTDVFIGGWSLEETGRGYRAAVSARDFAYALEFRAGQPALLEGERGFSRKGPGPGQASYYYSVPHLAVSGEAEIRGRRVAVSGEAWLDHEWSSEPLAKDAVGWDWVGVNLADGGSLMAFRIRAKDGGALWAGGTIRGADGRARALRPSEVRFAPLRRWRSPRTGAEYPVEMRVQAGALALDLEPLMDDQELDARASTGTVYWEGAVNASRGGKIVGRGYLELTGYFAPLKL